MSEEELNQALDAVARESGFTLRPTEPFGQFHQYNKELAINVLFKGLAEPLREGINPATSRDYYLDTMAAHWAGVFREPAIPTQGNLRAFVDRAINVPKDAVFISASGVQFKVREATPIETPSGIVPIEALRAGDAANLIANTTLQPERVLGGLREAVLEAGWISQEGVDEESDAEVRLRVKTAFANVAMGDISQKYITRVEKMNNVRNAVVWRVPRGAGSADIVIAAKDGVVTEAMLQEVQAYLSEWGQVNWDISVVAATKQALSVAVVIENPELSEESVREVIQQYALSLPINGLFDLKSVYERLNYGVNITSPVTNQRAGQYSEWELSVSFSQESIKPLSRKARHL